MVVTTSSFGPDAYEFAKDKPMSLVDGPNQIAMLQRHGRSYRIDLLEARRLNLDAKDWPAANNDLNREGLARSDSRSLIDPNHPR
jgi:hypothetical protein